jgi:FdhD protein
VAALFVVAFSLMSIASYSSPVLPHLTQAQAELTRHIDVVNEHGAQEQVAIPAERALTVYVDKREIVTLMTLGAHPELCQ